MRTWDRELKQILTKQKKKPPKKIITNQKKEGTNEEISYEQFLKENKLRDFTKK